MLYNLYILFSRDYCYLKKGKTLTLVVISKYYSDIQFSSLK